MNQVAVDTANESSVNRAFICRINRYLIIPQSKMRETEVKIEAGEN